MSLELQIITALLLDLIFGDPRSLPHPVRWIGRLAAVCEKFYRNAVPDQYIAGVLTVTSVLLATAMAAGLLLNTAAFIHPAAHDIISVLLLYTCFAAKDLARHSRDVETALRQNNIAAARSRVAMIVGRDTKDLNEQEIARASVESVAENIVDGVTAPLFFAFCGGPVAAILYKAINTLDSTFRPSFSAPFSSNVLSFIVP